LYFRERIKRILQPAPSTTGNRLTLRTSQQLYTLEQRTKYVMAKIALIVGSVRRDRQGIKVARWMEEKLKTRNHTVYFIDPLELNLPLLDRMYKEMVDPSEKMKTLRNKISDAEGYLAVTPEYNSGPSGAMKNTLDYFLEEYYFKPSAIVSYSPGMFGGINAAQQLRVVFAELGAPSISSSFTIPRLHKVFSEDGKLIDEAYNKRVSKFLVEFEWYIEAFKNQRAKGTPY
jgi:NAD(P)H-dependent FMN reductase